MHQVDEPLPRQVIIALDNAVDEYEAEEILLLYRKSGLRHAIQKAAWLNKKRSPEGRQHYQLLQQYFRNRQLISKRIQKKFVHGTISLGVLERHLRDLSGR